MAVNVTVKVKNRDNLERALSIFKKSVRESGVMLEYYKSQEYIKPSVKKRKKLAESKFNQKKLNNS